MRYLHQFWLLFHKDDIFVLDLSTSQYGFHEPLSSYDDYLKHIKIGITKFNPGGHEKTQVQSEGLSSTNTEIAFAHTAAIKRAILAWARSRNMTMRRLLRMPQREFDQRSADLLATCNHAINVSWYRLFALASRVPPGNDVGLVLGEILRRARATKVSNPQQQRCSRKISYAGPPEVADFFNKEYEELNLEQKDMVDSHLRITCWPRSFGCRYAYVDGMLYVKQSTTTLPSNS